MGGKHPERKVRLDGIDVQMNDARGRGRLRVDRDPGDVAVEDQYEIGVGQERTRGWRARKIGSGRAVSFDWTCPVFVDGLILGSQAIMHRLRECPLRVEAV